MKFEAPEMNVVKFDVEDILTASAGDPTAPSRPDCPTRTAEEDL